MQNPKEMITARLPTESGQPPLDRKPICNATNGSSYCTLWSTNFPMRQRMQRQRRPAIFQMTGGAKLLD
jgi:hypothetical protein